NSRERRATARSDRPQGGRAWRISRSDGFVELHPRPGSPSSFFFLLGSLSCPGSLSSFVEVVRVRAVEPVGERAAVHGAVVAGGAPGMRYRGLDGQRGSAYTLRPEDAPRPVGEEVMLAVQVEAPRDHVPG